LHTALTKMFSRSSTNLVRLAAVSGALLATALLGACDANSSSTGAAGAAALAGSATGGAGGAALGGAGGMNATMAGGGSAGSATSGGTSSGGTGGGGTSSSGTSGSGASGAGGTLGNAGSGGTALGGQSGGGAGGGGAYRPCPTDASPCKIMPFGDSITDGFGTDGSYRIELFRLAHQAGKNITFVGSQSNGPSMVDGVPFPPQHEGHSGFTIYPTPSRSGISPFVDTSIPQFAPHIITLMIGTNDAIDDYQMANAPTRLGMLIDAIFSKLPSVLLVVAEPIPSQDDALNGRLQTYGAAIPAIVKARADAGKHILVVDMYAPLAAVTDYKTSLLKDTWHPNVAGDVILGQKWYSVLAPSL